jgi:putative DNA primase/helicase
MDDQTLLTPAQVQIVIPCGSELKPQPIRWLWNGWLAAGKLHVLAGAPGSGKTTIGAAMAATITVGGRWPDRTPAGIGDVVIWSGEDDPADTLVPRLLASGADIDRVHFVGDVADNAGYRPFDPAKDVPVLCKRLEAIGNVRLLIVDPIVSAVATDSHRNAEVRRALQPLVDLAGRLGCAVLGITHLTKGTAGRDPIERLNGSLAFGAMARIVMIASKQRPKGEDDNPPRLLLRAKSNIGADDGGFEYGLYQSELEAFPGVFASSAQWGAPVDGNARDLLQEAEDNAENDGDTLLSAADVLNEALSERGGSISHKEAMALANAYGISQRTKHRARASLGLLIRREGFGKSMSSRWIKSPEGKDRDPSHSCQKTSIVPYMPNKIVGTNGTNGGTNDEKPHSCQTPPTKNLGTNGTYGPDGTNGEHKPGTSTDDDAVIF